jgi:hypothetical protein
MSHLHMSLMGYTGSAYPASGSHPATMYNATTTLGDSDFPADGSEDAIIYSMSSTTSFNGSRWWRVLDRAGRKLIHVDTDGAAPTSADFGPEGLRVPGGFSVELNSTVMFLTIVYDRVSSNA